MDLDGFQPFSEVFRASKTLLEARSRCGKAFSLKAMPLEAARISESSLSGPSSPFIRVEQLWDTSSSSKLRHSEAKEWFLEHTFDSHLYCT